MTSSTREGLARPWLAIPAGAFIAAAVSVSLALRPLSLGVLLVAWLGVGFLVWAALSLAAAPSRYLGAIELSRQAKFLLVFLYAANGIESKRARHRVWVAVLLIVLLQGGVTIFRFTFQFYDPFF